MCASTATPQANPRRKVNSTATVSPNPRSERKTHRSVRDCCRQVADHHPPDRYGRAAGGGAGAASMSGNGPGRAIPGRAGFSAVSLKSRESRIRTTGSAVQGRLLILANHISWIDIPALAAATGTAFVAMTELRWHPLLRWLCDMNDTVFVARHDRASIAAQVEALRMALSEKHVGHRIPRRHDQRRHGIAAVQERIAGGARSAGAGHDRAARLARLWRRSHRTLPGSATNPASTSVPAQCLARGPAGGTLTLHFPGAADRAETRSNRKTHGVSSAARRLLFGHEPARLLQKPQRTNLKRRRPWPPEPPRKPSRQKSSAAR